jgi:hypothetical protein
MVRVDLQGLQIGVEALPLTSPTRTYGRQPVDAVLRPCTEVM